MAAENLLLDWLAVARVQLQEAGFECRVRDRKEPSSCTAVDLDGRRFVGTICYWPPDRFELQFNSAESGEVVVLETKSFSSTETLGGFVDKLLRGMDVGAAD